MKKFSYILLIVLQCIMLGTAIAAAVKGIEFDAWVVAVWVAITLLDTFSINNLKDTVKAQEDMMDTQDRIIKNSDDIIKLQNEILHDYNPNLYPLIKDKE